MRNKHTRPYLFILLLIIACTSGYAQSDDPESGNIMLDYARQGRGHSEINNWSIQLNFGFSQFHGNLADQGFFGKLGGESPFAYSLIVSRKFTPLFTLRGQLLNTNIVSSGPDEFNRYGSDTANAIDLNFDADLFELNLNGKFDLSYAFWGSRRNRKLSWYGTAGLGFANWRTTLFETSTGQELTGTGQAGGLGQRTSEIVFPLGMGLDYKLDKRWSLHLEHSFHIVNSDILDAYEGGGLNDMFTYTSVGISYSFAGLRSMGRSRPSDGQPMLIDYPDVEGYYKPKEKAATEAPMDTTAQERQQFLTPEYEGSFTISGERGGDTAKSLAMEDERMEEITIKRTSPVSTDTGYDDVTFHVQIFAARKRISKQALANKFNIRKNITEYYNGDLYRYVAGTFERYTVANTYAKVLHEKGVYDAFVVAYRNGKRVSVHLVK